MTLRTVPPTRPVTVLDCGTRHLALLRRTASILVCATLLPVTASAQVRIDVELNQTALDAGLTEADGDDTVNEIIASELKLDGVTGFLDSMAKAQAMANKGMGADYASNIKKFEVGGSVSSALNGAGFSFKKGQETLPQGGFAAHVTLMGGINLGLMASKKKAFGKRFRLYGNGLYMPLPGGEAFGGTMYNMGAHLQVKVVNGADAKVTEWGGIDIYTGSSDLQADLRGPIKGTVKPALKNERLGDATLAFDAAGAPDAYVPRIFAGGQLAIGPLKGYGHRSVGFNQTYGGHRGGRLAW